MVTLRDIAKVAFVSQTTVSKVLNGKYREVGITPDCASRVRTVAAQLGYRPNRAARATASGRFNTIALLKLQSNVGLGQLPEGLLNGVEEGSRNRGYQLSFCSVGLDFDKPGRMPHILRESWADGFLLFGDWDPSQRLASLVRQLELPLVVLGVKELNDCIYPDEADACRQATEQLLNAGHKRIAYLTDPRLHSYAQTERRAAFADTMQQAGLTGQVIEIPAEYRRVEVRPWQDRAEARRLFLQSPDRPTAVVVDTVDVAYPLLDEARHMGLRLPEDLAMITFHDVIASALGMCISTMLLRCGDLGVGAVELLYNRITEGKALPAISVKYEYAGGHTI